MIPKTQRHLPWSANDQYKEVYDCYMRLLLLLSIFLCTFVPSAAAQGVGLVALRTSTVGRQSTLQRVFLRPSRRGTLRLPVQRALVPLGSQALPRKPSMQPAAVQPASDIYGDAAVRQNILLLGDVSSAIAGVQFFSNSEPLDVNEIRIIFSASVPSVESLLLYDETRHLLGRATLDASVSSRREYRLSLGASALTLPHRVPLSIYVRAQIRGYREGGVSGEDVQVSSVRVTGNGQWSTNEYVQTSTETFPAFAAARAGFSRIANAGSSSAMLMPGSQVALGQFVVEGRENDSTADLRITDLIFTLSKSSDITVSSPIVRLPDGSASHACSVAGSTITCSGIPASITAVDSKRAFDLRADVAISGTTNTSFLNVSINNPGSPGTHGDVTWTDGTTSFGWLPMDTPVVRGTVFSR